MLIMEDRVTWEELRNAAESQRTTAQHVSELVAALEPAQPLRWGMSAPEAEWGTRLGEVGPDLIHARRLFAVYDGSPALADILTLARAEISAGRLPVVSAKYGPGTWADIAAGRGDAHLDDIAAQLAALNGQLFFTIHHEPVGDGTATDYAAMCVRAYPRIKAAAPTVMVGPIFNGFVFSARSQGWDDAEIAEWLPDELLAASDVFAADCYQGGTTADPGEDAGVKLGRMSQWADRRGILSLAAGEFNGLTAAAITSAMDAVKADPRFVFACIFNSDRNNRDGVSWRLTGDRLTAFQTGAA